MMRRGVGQLPPGCVNDFDLVMQNWFQSLSAQPASDAAVGCGPSNGAPCTDPVSASRMAIAIAAQYCSVNNDGKIFGCPPDPACSDGGVAAAQPYVAKALAFFQNLPASVWATEATNLSTGQFYGPGASTVPYNTPSPEQPSGSPAYIAAQTGQPAPTGSPYSYLPPTQQPSSSSPAPAQPAAGSSSTTGAAADPLAWLTATSVGGFANWELIVAGIAALVILPVVLRGGR